jgi:hypothetical protein
MREELRTERRRVRSADDDVRARVASLDLARHERDAAAVRGPAAHRVDVGLEAADNLLDERPAEGREVEELHLVAGAHRLGREREEAVRRLVEVAVEVALAVALRGAVAPVVGRRPALGDLPGGRVQERDPHAVCQA